MLVPDPNFFGGIVQYSAAGGDYMPVDAATEAFGAPNWPWSAPATRANYRMLGVADLIDAANKDREPRCSGRLAAHVVDVMESILLAAAERRHVTHPHDASTARRRSPPPTRSGCSRRFKDEAQT